MNGWKKGPLPPDTWQWGGVVPLGQDSAGFYFADFCGDHVKIVGDSVSRVLKAEEVGWYNNCLGLAPTGGKRLDLPKEDA